MGNVDIGQSFVKGWELFAKNPLALVVGTLIYFVLSVASLGLLMPILTAGFYVMIRKSWDDEEAEIGDIFAGFSNFIPYFLAGLIYLVLFMMGILMCGVGAVVTMAAALFIFPLMVEKGLDAGDAMSRSFDIFKEEWFPLLVFSIICYIVESLGNIAFGIALLITLPYAKCMVFVIYKQLVPDAEPLLPETEEQTETTDEKKL